jgi:hypothetical protein
LKPVAIELLKHQNLNIENHSQRATDSNDENNDNDFESCSSFSLSSAKSLNSPIKVVNNTSVLEAVLIGFVTFNSLCYVFDYVNGVSSVNIITFRNRIMQPSKGINYGYKN